MIVVDESLLSKASSKRGRMQRACLEVLLEHEAAMALPTSVRFVYYELKQRGVETGMRGTRSDQNIIDATFHLREVGIVPWDWIVDETRSVSSWSSGPTILDHAIDLADALRIDPWQGTCRPFIICETRSVRGGLSQLVRDYLVPITSTNGQCGGHLRTGIAPRLDSLDRIGYIGDFNRAGSSIEANTRRVLEREVGPLLWERLAITLDQVDGSLTGGRRLEPNLDTDTRYKDNGSHVSYEAEALGQAVLVDLVRSWLDTLLPEPLGVVQEREQSEREELLGILEEARWER